MIGLVLAGTLRMRVSHSPITALSQIDRQACLPCGQSSDTGDLAPALRFKLRRSPDWLKMRTASAVWLSGAKEEGAKKNNGCRML
jgi:hypothetical protein